MTIEMIDGRSTIHACNCKDATPCMNDCTCNVNKVSEIIDADKETILRLQTQKATCSQRMDFIRYKYAALTELELAPLVKQHQELDNALLEFLKPVCFGGYDCTDDELEACANHTSSACWRARREADRQVS